MVDGQELLEVKATGLIFMSQLLIFQIFKQETLQPILSLTCFVQLRLE